MVYSYSDHLQRAVAPMLSLAAALARSSLPLTERGRLLEADEPLTPRPP
jgi:hypothetical protein